MPLGVDFDPPTPTLTAGLIGDPFSKLDGNSLGDGGRGGIGHRGCCGAIGDGRDSIADGGLAGHRISPPQLIYKVEPEFSEEARKAKFQGTVVLSVQVDASGKPSHLIVVSSPGLGLDEKAINAVARWLFRPAYRDGKPFPTTARIEVSFHLL
jgi:protein TonB